MNDILPFHKWKEEFMKTDKIDGIQVRRDRYTYYSLYGGYVSKLRKQNGKPTK